jgi:hypothetical protein
MVRTAGQTVLMVLETVATAKTPKDPPVSVGYHHTGYSEDIHHIYQKVRTRDHILIQVNKMYI